MAEERFWYLVCYDIREPKRWRRCFKLLKGYGTSLQYSIFRCRLTRRQLERMRWELEKELASERQPNDCRAVFGLYLSSDCTQHKCRVDRKSSVGFVLCNH